MTSDALGDWYNESKSAEGDEGREHRRSAISHTAVIDMSHGNPSGDEQIECDFEGAQEVRSLLSIYLLIGQPHNECVAESNESLGLHGLLNSTSHCTNSGSDLLNSAA